MRSGALAGTETNGASWSEKRKPFGSSKFVRHASTADAVYRPPGFEIGARYSRVLSLGLWSVVGNARSSTALVEGGQRRLDHSKQVWI